MNASQGLSEFKRGLELLRNNYPGSALLHLRRAVELDNDNPYYLSFLGVSVANALHKWADAEVLCETALKLKRSEPRLYLNLAEVYVKAGRRGDAAETIQMGIEHSGETALLVHALDRLRVRRPALVPFVPRQHALNRGLGRLRHRLLSMLGRSEYQTAS